MSKPQRPPRAGVPEPPSEDLILAALERALRHRAGPGSAVPIWTVLEHLAVPRRGSGARHVRAVLRSLQAAGRVEPSRPHGVEAWTLTGAGRRRMLRTRRAGLLPPLPESPQHREWRNARTAAAQEIDRFEDALRERLCEAADLLDGPVGGSSDAWFEIAERLRGACRHIGSARHCLTEWAEPDEQGADHDTRVDRGDEELNPAELLKRRARRQGRRNIRLWREWD